MNTSFLYLFLNLLFKKIKVLFMHVIKVIAENKNEYKVELDKSTLKGKLNNELFSWNVIKIKDHLFHAIKDDKSYNLELLKLNSDEKTVFVKVNGVKFKMQLQNKYDELLHILGMDNLLITKVAELKAPMPGLVLSLLAKEGETVQKGDTLLILEAMKMENAIKSPTDGVIKNISVNTGEAVEKNQLILNFQ
ncbi:MAG: acetyl-CoA carboxylase biotin carboxyl carrier protein subunit [Flavobacteriales bacterium CG_4_9_14_0_2_um_filter_32_27]|nr:MAG: acetyl-CoA carboxylase biotin carboxyl carrier protein subunit [Flavobacteriales bacterium CG_4_9_14_0_2_um_filter_32_27]